jgi:hypothetical protein
LFCISVSFFFLKFSVSWVTSSLILSIFYFNSFIYLFVMVSISVWSSFSASMISFISFYVFSYSLVLLSWNFLSASYTFWLTMSSNISMKLSLITCRISSFRVFLWASLGSLVWFIFVLLEYESGYLFSLFRSKSCSTLFFGGK